MLKYDQVVKKSFLSTPLYAQIFKKGMQSVKLGSHYDQAQ